MEPFRLKSPLKPSSSSQKTAGISLRRQEKCYYLQPLNLLVLKPVFDKYGRHPGFGIGPEAGFHTEILHTI